MKTVNELKKEIDAEIKRRWLPPMNYWHKTGSVVYVTSNPSTIKKMKSILDKNKN